MKLALVSLVFAAAAAAQLSFEVASIKPNNSGSRDSNYNTNDGRLVMRNVSLRMIIEVAYDLKDHMLIAPDWLDTPHFDITAKMPGLAEPAEVRSMEQSLLAERFQLKAHRTSKEMSGYALLPAKSGFKLKPTEADLDSSVNWSSGGRKAKATGKHASMAQIADFLTGHLERPVVDQSGIPGAYDFTLEWSPDQQGNDAGPSLFTALNEELGLRLEPRKLPVSILVVDSVSKTPTEN